MQVSLNPLLANMVSGDKLASALTFGQFMKAIASFLGPVIAGWVLLKFGNWLYLFPVFFVIAMVAAVGLSVISIAEQKKEEKSSFMQCIALLGDRMVLVLFLGIVCHVGMDVGINMTLPKILMERVGVGLSEAGYASSAYFLFRTIGCFVGAFALAHCSGRKFFKISLFCLSLGLVGLLFFQDKMFLYVSIAFVGLGNSNVFSIIFSQALLHAPTRKNEISGLMIMGLSGGAVFPLFMGLLSDFLAAQFGAVSVLCGGVCYLLYVAMKMR